MSIKNFNFCGLPVSSFTKAELEEYIENHLDKKENKVIYGHSLGIFPRLLRQPHTVKYIMDYNLYVSDGHKFHQFGKSLGFPFKYKISLPQITFLILEIVNKLHGSVYLLGANQSSNITAIKKIKEKYKNIKNCYGHHGYFSEDDDNEIIKDINEKNPDVLFLGMPSPMKEKFIFKNKNSLNVGISVLNGGMIDVLAEKAKLTPPALKKLGLALIFRFIQAPKHKIYQFLSYYPLIGFYFIPSIFYRVKVLKKKSCRLEDFTLLKRKFKKHNLVGF